MWADRARDAVIVRGVFLFVVCACLFLLVSSSVSALYVPTGDEKVASNKFGTWYVWGGTWLPDSSCRYTVNLDWQSFDTSQGVYAYYGIGMFEDYSSISCTGPATPSDFGQDRSAMTSASKSETCRVIPDGSSTILGQLTHGAWEDNGVDATFIEMDTWLSASTEIGLNPDIDITVRCNGGSCAGSFPSDVTVSASAACGQSPCANQANGLRYEVIDTTASCGQGSVNYLNNMNLGSSVVVSSSKKVCFGARTCTGRYGWGSATVQIDSPITTCAEAASEGYDCSAGPDSQWDGTSLDGWHCSNPSDRCCRTGREWNGIACQEIEECRNPTWPPPTFLCDYSPSSDMSGSHNYINDGPCITIGAQESCCDTGIDKGGAGFNTWEDAGYSPINLAGGLIDGARFCGGDGSVLCKSTANGLCPEDYFSGAYTCRTCDPDCGAGCNVKPVVSIASPNNGDTVTCYENIVASASDIDDGVDYVEFYIDGVLRRTDSSSPYTYYWNSASYYPGTVDIEVIAYDNSGQASDPDTISVTVAYCDQDPTVVITDPTSGTISGTYQVKATATDDLPGIQYVEFYIDGVYQSRDSTGPNPYDWWWNTLLWSDGDYSLQAYTVDSAGNDDWSPTYTITINNGPPPDNPPSISITNPPNGATGLSGNVAFTANAADDYGVSKVDFRVDGGPWVTDTTNPYGITWNTASLADGSHTIEARATDTASHTTSDSHTVFTENDADPTVSFTTPAAGATLSGTQLINVTASDDNGINYVQFRLDGGPWQQDPSSPYQYTFVTTSVSDGSHTVDAQARDTANQYSIIKSRSFTVSNPVDNPPSVNIVDPNNGDTIRGVQLVNASASDDIGVALVRFRIDGGAWTNDNTAPYQYSFDTTSVGAGSHTIEAQAEDTLPQSSGIALITVNVPVDNPPTAQIDDPNDGASGLSGTIVINGSATDDYGVDRMEFQINSGPWQQDSTAPYQYSWDTTSVADGSHTIRARSYDTLNQVSPVVDVITVDVSNIGPQPPIITIDDPADGAAVRTTTLINVTATDPDGSVTRVDFYIDGALQGNDPNDGDDTYTWSWDAPAEALGAHTILAQAFDNSGSHTDATASVTVIDDFPTISIVDPADGATLRGTQLVNASASDDVGVDRVEFSIDGGVWVADTTAPYQYSLDTTGLSAGAHTIDARVFDTRGQMTSTDSTGNTITITVDNPPTITIVDPPDGATIKGTQLVNATATDDVGINRVEFSIDGGAWVADNTAPYQYSLDTTILGPGAHTIDARAYDTALQMASTAITGNTITITVDNPPTVTIDDPNNGDTIDGTQLVNATANDDIAIDRVEFSIDGGAWSADNTAPYQYSLDTTSLVNGAHTIAARAYDNALQVSTTDTISVNINNIDNPPTVNLFDPVDGQQVNETYTVRATANDDNGISRVEFRIDSGSWNTDSTSPYTYNWDTTLYVEGPHTISARSVDTAAQTSGTDTIAVSTCRTGTTWNGTACVESDCSNGADDDGDGFPDGTDPDCGGGGECTTGACCDLTDGTYRPSTYLCVNNSPTCTSSCESSEDDRYCTGSSNVCPGPSPIIRHASVDGEMCVGGTFIMADCTDYLFMTGSWCDATQPSRNATGCYAGIDAVGGLAAVCLNGASCTDDEHWMCLGGSCYNYCWEDTDIDGNDDENNDLDINVSDSVEGLCEDVCSASSCAAINSSYVQGGCFGSAVDSNWYGEPTAGHCSVDSCFCYACPGNSTWNPLAVPPQCQEGLGPNPYENCHNGVDDDEDGKVDLFDPDCVTYDANPEITLSVNNSNPNIGEPIRISWTINDDNGTADYTLDYVEGFDSDSVITPYSDNIVHPFSTVGTFVINLTATDSHGQKNSTTTTVTTTCIAGTVDGAPAPGPGWCCSDSCYDARTSECFADSDAGSFVCPGDWSSEDMVCNASNHLVEDRDSSVLWEVGGSTCDPGVPPYAAGWVDEGDQYCGLPGGISACDTYDGVAPFMCGDDNQERYERYSVYDDFEENNPVPVAYHEACLDATSGTNYSRNEGGGGGEVPSGQPEDCSDEWDSDADGYLPFYDDECRGGDATIHVYWTDTDDVRQEAPYATITVDVTNPYTGITTLYDEQQTGTDGTYTFTGIPIGTHTVTATFGNTISNSTSITILDDADTSKDIDLYVRICNADCTNNLGYCDRFCLGRNGCPEMQYLIGLGDGSDRVMNASHPPGRTLGRRFGELVILERTDTERLVGIACTGPAEWQPAPKANVQGDVENLVKYTRIVRINNVPVRLVVTSFS